jgi:flavin-dependent dehydrogenase
MSQTPWDAIVIGAGPAGTVMAYALAQRRHRVLLLDKARFPRAKVCGCCINQRAVALLDYLGLGSVVGNGDALPLDRFALRVHGRCAAVALPGGRVQSRAVLDRRLAQAAGEAGAVFHDDTQAQVQPIAPGDVHRRVTCTQSGVERVEHARLVVAADGLSGASLNQLDAMAWRPEAKAPVGLAATGPSHAAPPAGTIAMAVGRGGYVGRVRLPDGSADVAGALHPPAMRRAGGRDALVSQILRDAHGTCPFEPEALRWQGTATLHRTRAVAAHRLLVVGDAAGYVEPFTGEGIAWAIEGAHEAARLADATLVSDRAVAWQQLGAQWRRAYRRHIVRRQRRCRWMARGLRYPALTRLAATIIHRAPMCSTPWVATLAGAKQSAHA